MKLIFLCIFILLLSSCSQEDKTQSKQGNLSANSSPVKPQKPQPAAEKITWDELIPEAYSPDVVIGKYQAQLDKLEDNSEGAEEIYKKIMDELNSAPLNEKLKNKRIKLPGFIAPISHSDGKISAFLLVPYFGACIHVPPPPINQTLLVQLTPEQYINPDDIYKTFYVSGTIQLEGKITEIGNAGYTIQDAIIEPYTEDY